MSARLLALVAGLALVGCGGGGDRSADEAAVTKTVQRWTHAVVDHDGPAACAELSSRLRKAIARHLLGEGVRGSCRSWAARYVSPRHPASNHRARVAAVEIRGLRAVAHLSAPGVRSADTMLVKEHGRWRIDDY